MKTKFLFFSAIAFFIMGLHSPEGLLFYFFSLHLSMLYVGVLCHRRELKLRAKNDI